MSFSYDEDQNVTLLLGREKRVAGFGAIMREVDGGGRIAGHYPQDFSGLHCRDALASPQHRERAQQSADIKLGVVVYQFAGHGRLFQLILVMPISS
jgi:hypothetical protein